MGLAKHTTPDTGQLRLKAEQAQCSKPLAEVCVLILVVITLRLKKKKKKRNLLLTEIERVFQHVF